MHLKEVSKMATEKIRVNVYVTEETKKYLQEQSEMLGVSVSGLINVCINNYKQQAEAIVSMNAIQQVVQELKSLKADNAKA